MHKASMGRKYVVFWFFLAILIRLMVMPTALHVDSRFTGDIIQLNRAAYAIYTGDLDHLWYPPLFYFSLGLIQRVLLPERPLFVSMPIDGLENQTLLLSDPLIFRTLALLKTCYLVFDMGIALLLWRMSRDKGQEAAVLFYLFNPLIIYNAYFHGQFDVMPLFFITLGLYFGKRGQAGWAAFWIGIAGCFKNFPLLFLPPVIVILAETWRERFKLLLFGIVPYIMLMLPFLGTGTTGLGEYQDWFFKGGYDLGFGAQVYFFLAFYAFLLWHLDNRQAQTFEDLWRACFAILLVYYQFSYFDLHYWAWIVPFAAIYFAECPREATPFYLVILACLLVLATPTPLGRFFAPISPRFFLRLPSLMEALNPYLPMQFLINVVRSLLAGTCFFLAYRLLRDMPASRRDAGQAAPGPVVVD